MTTKGLIKKYKRDYDLIIRLYSLDKLYLTTSQVNKFLKLRGEKKYPHYEIRNGRQVIIYDKIKSKREKRLCRI
jgi:hypothetical protein